MVAYLLTLLRLAKKPDCLCPPPCHATSGIQRFEQLEAFDALLYVSILFHMCIKAAFPDEMQSKSRLLYVVEPGDRLCPYITHLLTFVWMDDVIFIVLFTTMP